jgi:tetratricopeptide (TPR) repeat protein
MTRVTRWPWWLVLLLAALPVAAASTPDDPKQLFERGFLSRAAALCEQRLAADAHDADAAAVLSRIRSTQGDMNEALKLATAAVAADPKNADAQYALAEVYGRKARDASMPSAAGLAGKMRKAADAALAIDPHHIDALEIDVDFFSMAPGFMGGDKKKAAEYTERMIQADPVAGWIKKGENALRAKDTTLAAQCYEHAAEVQPPSGRALVQLAAWLAQSWRDPARSEKLALQAVQAEPWRVGGWQVLASLYAFQGRYAELDDLLKRSEEAEPSHLAPWYQAGRQLVVSRKDPVRAEGYLRHYLSQEPEIGSQSWAAARWRLALALEQQGKKSEAIGELDTAVKLDPKLEDAKKDLKRLRG